MLTLCLVACSISGGDVPTEAAPGVPAPTASLPPPTPESPAPIDEKAQELSVEVRRAMEASPWFAGRGRWNEAWFAASDDGLAKRIKTASFTDLTTGVAAGVSVDLRGTSKDLEFDLVVGEGLPFRAGPCMGGCEVPRLKLRAVLPGVVEFDVMLESAPNQTCRMLGFADVPAGPLRLHQDGRIDVCGSSRKLVPGVSPFTRWFSLERTTAGRVPSGYTYCFVVSPECAETSLQTVCRTDQGLFTLLPSPQLIDDFGWACGNGSPFFTATE